MDRVGGILASNRACKELSESDPEPTSTSEFKEMRSRSCKFAGCKIPDRRSTGYVSIRGQKSHSRLLFSSEKHYKC